MPLSYVSASKSDLFAKELAPEAARAHSQGVDATNNGASKMKPHYHARLNGSTHWSVVTRSDARIMLARLIADPVHVSFSGRAERHFSDASGKIALVVRVLYSTACITGGN
jgi:hypothetical protein